MCIRDSLPAVTARVACLVHSCCVAPRGAAAAAIIMGPKRPLAPPAAWQTRQAGALWTYRQQVEFLRRRDAEPPPPSPAFPGGPCREPTAAASSSEPWLPPPPPADEPGLRPPTELRPEPRAEMTYLRYGGVLAMGFATQRFAVMIHGRPVVVAAYEAFRSRCARIMVRTCVVWCGWRSSAWHVTVLVPHCMASQVRLTERGSFGSRNRYTTAAAVGEGVGRPGPRAACRQSSSRTSCPGRSISTRTLRGC